MILYENTYEREGNDSWLKDYVQLHSNDMGLYLEHKKRWNGWNGEIKENYTLELDENDLEKSQKMIDEYINEHSLYQKFHNGEEEGIIIKLNELIN
jgi:hypothetical protein